MVRASDVAKVAGLAHGVNVKLQKCGGIAEARDLIAAARAPHLAPLADWADLDRNLLVVDDPFVAVEVSAGRFVYPERAGLGAIPRAPVRPTAGK